MSLVYADLHPTKWNFLTFEAAIKSNQTRIARGRQGLEAEAEYLGHVTMVTWDDNGTQAPLRRFHATKFLFSDLENTVYYLEINSDSSAHN